MGCKFCKGRSPLSSATLFKNEREQSSIKKQYSWDKKDRVNPKDYTIENLKGEVSGRLPGTINGQQFIVQNCENSSIYLFDYINTVTVDDCINCNIVIGPTKGSVFIRNCKDCRMIVACQQFRTRDCQRLTTFLCCKTHPIIEASTQMKFGCYRYFYQELEKQFHDAGLSIFNNDWCDVRDFTPVEGDCNWLILPKDCKIQDHVPIPSKEDLLMTAGNASYDVTDFSVPYTYGMKQKTFDESSIVVFFSDGHSHSRAQSFMREMDTRCPLIKLLRTKEIKMTVGDAKRVFQTDSYSSVVERGFVIGLEYNGDDSIQSCHTIAMEIATLTGSTGLLYVANNRSSAATQIKEFFDLTDMQMGLC